MALSNLSAIGALSGSLTLRFYFFGTSDTFGFANHECPNAGCGGTDVGRDIAIEGNMVPEPSTAALAGLGLVVLDLRRRRAH
jgi:PEP-CTERM motif